ncbi:hypothetical protein ACU4GD_21590 [Cupriavidus basilensis]
MLTGANFREDNTIKYSGQFGPVSALAHWSLRYLAWRCRRR